MADVKISALPLATTPLAGTEVLPIVQSATTDQVSVANLTAGRAVSAASLTLTTTPLAVGSGGTGFSSITSGYVPYATAANTLGSSSGLQFDGNNLGLGVTPSAWTSGFQVLENSGGALWSGSSSAVRLTQNVYYSTDYKYKTTAAASQYAQVAGQHIWYNAASGSANATITFTQAMTLDASGRLAIGTTTAINKLTVAGGANVNPPALGASGGSTFVYGSDGGYGLLTGQAASGNHWMQVQRIDGTATAYDLLLQPNGGNVGIGTSSPAAQLHVRNGGGNSISILGQYGTGTRAQVAAYSNQVDIRAYNGTNDVMTFTTGSSERARIDSSGNLLVTGGGALGYGTGSGGTVTQATDKATGVTLNKTVGRITTSNAALAANTTVSFTLTNSLIAVNDVIVINVDGNSTANGASYNVWALAGSGAAYFNIRNISGVSLSDIIYINFAIIKGATS